MTCGICDKHHNLEAHSGPVIAESEGWWLSHFPILPNEPTTLGRLVLETRRHMTDLSEIDSEEAYSLGVLIQKGCQALRKVLGAEHVYVFRINDKAPHLHFHLVPRFKDTPKEQWGVNMMSYVGTKVSLSEVHELSRRLRASLTS